MSCYKISKHNCVHVFKKKVGRKYYLKIFHLLLITTHKVCQKEVLNSVPVAKILELVILINMDTMTHLRVQPGMKCLIRKKVFSFTVSKN